jgi:hypothetical protein
MAQQKTRRRNRDEEEPERLEEEPEELEEEPEELEEPEEEEAGNVIGLRLKEGGVEIDLPRDGNEGKTLHAMADMLDAMS